VSFTTNIDLASQLVTRRLWPCLCGIRLSSLTIAAASRWCLTRYRSTALYCTAHNHGNYTATCVDHEETVDSRRDNMYVLPSRALLSLHCTCVMCHGSPRSCSGQLFPSVSEHPQHGRNWCVLSIKAIIMAFVSCRHITKSCDQVPEKVSTYGECIRIRSSSSSCQKGRSCDLTPSHLSQFPAVLVAMLVSTIPISILGVHFAMDVAPFWTPEQYR
jgi:hypothetical protein